jgi:arginase
MEIQLLAGEARQAGRFPIVLAGNCNTAVGTLAGLGADSTGVAWFDAHADFNTPETTSSGFLDGTAVAIITGRCWSQLAATVPGFAPIADERVCLVGVRDIDSLESELLESSAVKLVEPRKLRAGLKAALKAIGEHVDDLYVHLDLDVLDPATAKVNNYAAPGGLTLEDVEYALSVAADNFRIRGLTVSAYDPAADGDGAAARAALRLITFAASLAARS